MISQFLNTQASRKVDRKFRMVLFKSRTSRPFLHINLQTMNLNQLAQTHRSVLKKIKIKGWAIFLYRRPLDGRTSLADCHLCVRWARQRARTSVIIKFNLCHSIRLITPWGRMSAKRIHGCSTVDTRHLRVLSPGPTSIDQVSAFKLVKDSLGSVRDFNQVYSSALSGSVLCFTLA